MEPYSLVLLPASSALIRYVLFSYSESTTGFNILGDHFGTPPLGNATYDYVVLGGGTAGLAIGARLASEKAGTVAVIEAGGFYEFDDGNLSSVPGTVAYYIGTAPLYKNRLISWDYQTEPDSVSIRLGLQDLIVDFNCAHGALEDAAFYTILGKHSAEEVPATIWSMIGDQRVVTRNGRMMSEIPAISSKNSSHFFKRSLQLDLPNNAARAANASQLGKYHWVFAKLELAELGLKELPDFISGDLFGYQYSAQTINSRTQTRSSSETSYLGWTISSNSPLQVYKSTLAKRILFDSDKRATGVLVDTAGVQYSILANKEVVLSAGTHRSPQLLMVSGIGPQKVLQSLGIPVLSSLPGVGQNLWDQPYFGPSYSVSITTHRSISNPEILAQQVEAYRTTRTGYLTNPGTDFMAWENLPADLLHTLSSRTRHDLATNFPKDWPTLQHTFADADYGTGYGMLTGAPADGRKYVSIAPNLVATFSRGNITINSTDTSVNPIISPTLLSDPRDQEVAIAAFKRARQISSTASIKRIITGPEAYPDVDVVSDADILSYIKRTASPIGHASSSCKMGTSDDPMAVVDSQARVFGVTGLRVVDASAFAFQIPGHPQATVCEFSSPFSHPTALGILHPHR